MNKHIFHQIIKQWLSGYGAGFLIQGFQVQNHWMASRSTQSFTLLRSIKRVPAIYRDLVVKSKLSPHSGYAALR